MDLLQFIKQKFALPIHIENRLVKALASESYSKGDIILPPENQSKKIFFIEQGLARVFYAKDDKDITLQFLPENSFGLPVDSVFFNQVCKYGMEALEQCEVKSIYFSIWENLLLECPALEKLSRHLMVGYIKQTNDRVYHLQFQSAMERFENMMGVYPDIFMRAPINTIASYLGMSLESLSQLKYMRVNA